MVYLFIYCTLVPPAVNTSQTEFMFVEVPLFQQQHPCLIFLSTYGTGTLKTWTTERSQDTLLKGWTCSIGTAAAMLKIMAVQVVNPEPSPNLQGNQLFLLMVQGTSNIFAQKGRWDPRDSLLWRCTVRFFQAMCHQFPKGVLHFPQGFSSQGGAPYSANLVYKSNFTMVFVGDISLVFMGL